MKLALRSKEQIVARPAGRAEASVFSNAADVVRILAPDAPVYCFSPAALRSRIAEFLDGFPGEVSYAVKANAGEDVILTAAGCGIEVFDVASLDEMATVHSLAPFAGFHYHNPVKSSREICEAFAHYGCTRFAADDEREIRKIAACVGITEGVELAVRFRMPKHGASAHDFSSKFGATLAEAPHLLRLAADLGFSPVLTFHPGSQCTDPAAYVRHIHAAAVIAHEAGVTLAALNVGGGFPARYHAGAVPALPVFFAAIEAAAREAFAGTVPSLECEPGRGIVAPSVSLLTRVKLVKPQRSEVFLNDGIYGALMEVSQVPDLLPPYRVIRNGRVLAGETVPFVAYGPTCDPLDRLPVTLDLPADVAEDDFLEFGSLGAYGSATSTRFNGYGDAQTVIVEKVLGA